MNRIEVSAVRRTALGKSVKHLRREGLVPAVIYGHREEPVSLQLEARELAPALARAGEASLVTLRVVGEKEPRMALAREVQREPLTGKLVHVDFYQVVMTEKLTTQVPLAFVGSAPARSLADSMMLEALNEVEVECLPGDLVASIQVPVDSLRTFDDTIHVRDIVAPPGVTILTDPEEMVVKVVPVRVEVEAVEVAPAPAAEIEVIGKGKKEEEVAEETKE